MSKPFFSEDSIIVRVEKSRLKYNTRVSKPENCDVVIVSHDNVQRLKNLDGNILNPKKKSFWLFNKRDPNEYIIFFVDSAYHDASWGGNVQYAENKENAKQQKINIRASFSFKVYRLDRALSLLSETKAKYSKKYLVDKLRLRIDNTIKAYVSQALNEKGFIGAQSGILEVAEKAQEKLNQDVLSVFGVSMVSLNIFLEREAKYKETGSKE